MTPAGWTIMICSVAAVTILFIWCLVRVLTHKPPPNLHGIDDIETGAGEKD
ncbi:MAG TPA: hypothetical protein VFV23_05720 [Verrucomicrobiae bacterium]|nr:hypothetical protein [Verrucomicrobiae bacterium]